MRLFEIERVRKHLCHRKCVIVKEKEKLCVGMWDENEIARKRERGGGERGKKEGE
jgi:hypothetical protein